MTPAPLRLAPAVLAVLALIETAGAHAAASCPAGPLVADTTFTARCETKDKTNLGGPKTPTLTLAPASAWTSAKTTLSVVGNARLVNNGTLESTGGRAVHDDTGGLTLTVTNAAGAVIRSSADDAFQMGKDGSSVSLGNAGTIVSTKSRAVNWNALQKGTNTLANAASGQITATADDAVRLGANGVVDNSGLIESTGGTAISGKGKNAINSGIAITNQATGRILGAKHGITAGDANVNVVLTLTNRAGGVIAGADGSGVNIDGNGPGEVVTLDNAGDITGSGTTGDGDGVDVDGLLRLTNAATGRIRGLLAQDTSEGVTAGGGTIDNAGLIEGANGAGRVGRGITLAGVDKDADGKEIAVQPIVADSRITNSGTIRGGSGGAIALTSGVATARTLAIDNLMGGVIEALAAGAPTVATGVTATTLRTSGTLRAPAGGVAVDFGSSASTLELLDGLVAGDVRAADGSQALVQRGGTLAGNVALGAGADTATLAGGALAGALRMGAGSDVATLAAGFDATRLTALDGGDAATGARAQADANTLRLATALTGSSANVGRAGDAAITAWDAIALGDGATAARLALTGDLATGAATGRLAIAAQGTLALAAGTTGARVGYHVANAGTVSLQNGAPGDVLTLQGDYTAAEGATLALDACLGIGARADLLVVEGGAAGGTALAVAPAAGAGCAGAATTGAGIELVRVAGAAATQQGLRKAAPAGPDFVLAGGAITQGGFVYRLAQVGASWYLQAAPVAVPGNPGNPGTPGSPTDPATPAPAPGAASVQPVPADAPWALAALAAALGWAARRERRRR